MKKRLLSAALAVCALSGCSPSPTENAVSSPQDSRVDVVGRDPLPLTETLSSDSTTGRGPNTFGSGN
jgi:hypothetical protein